MSNDFLVSTVSSSLAGLLARSICHPIDTCKAKLQSADTFRGVLDVVRTTYRKEGVPGFYRGLGAVLVGGVPGVCVYISTYEACKEHLQQYSWIRANPFLSYFASGMVAEAVCCTLFVPVDVIKERLQVQSNRPDKAYSGSLDALRTIAREEGVGVLYKGYTATLFSYGPFSALYFLMYEEAKDRLAQARDSGNSGNSGAKLSFADNLLCSAVAGSLASFLTNPLDLAKLRYQVQRSSTSSTPTSTSAPTPTHSSAPPLVHEQRYTGLTDALQKLYRQGGVRGLFRGALTRVLFFTPSTAITMAAYDKLKDLLSK
ncbi:mitochondrial carrier domain-containing protein [Ochromonadaceae sp. CCMP2298]|nr:mitochondrial carrier domain-containing protein [Ochromonadaceae sp. CCMP2298]|mmetsp:Transcript_1051/g.2330  ORF Transcript_1051/g.2330 Transcript_1051/m.2330 type:complete len:315 (-) Transcript_1051:153-1097(-)